VDPSSQRPQLPSWLKQTPTLVISGEPEPRTNSDVMNWLYEQKMKDGVTTGAKGEAMAAGPVDPEPYLDMEMGGGYGDSYSFLGTDTSAQGNGGLSMKHNFTYLNGQESVGTREASTFQTTTTNQKRSKKEELFDQQYEQMMASRNNSVKGPQQRL